MDHIFLSIWKSCKFLFKTDHCGPTTLAKMDADPSHLASILCKASCSLLIFLKNLFSTLLNYVMKFISLQCTTLKPHLKSTALDMYGHPAMVVDLEESHLFSFLFMLNCLSTLVWYLFLASINCRLVILLLSVMLWGINCYLFWSRSLRPLVQVCSDQRRAPPFLLSLFLAFSDKLLACSPCSLLLMGLPFNFLSYIAHLFVFQSTLKLEFPHTLFQIVSSLGWSFKGLCSYVLHILLGKTSMLLLWR